jgi:hypothetical protein
MWDCWITLMFFSLISFLLNLIYTFGILKKVKVMSSQIQRLFSKFQKSQSHDLTFFEGLLENTF